MKKYFYREESGNGYMLRPNHDALYAHYTTGSFAILGARIMGLSFPQYLRMCRDIYGAELIGRNQLYPIVLFRDSKKLDTLIAELNQRADILLKGR